MLEVQLEIRMRSSFAGRISIVADIETLATTTIESLVAMCPRLKSYIAKNDKTPLTDGFIDLYSGLGRTNAEIVGRIDVQVKGRSTRNGRVPTNQLLDHTE